MAEEIEELRAENERLKRELADARTVIRRAKDPEPVQRPSWKRVIKIVCDACMSLQRLAGGWQLSMGHLKRRFRSLKEIWEILSQEEWSLTDIFSIEPKGTVKPRLIRRYPVLAPWLPFVSVSTAQHSDSVCTSIPPVTEVSYTEVFDPY